MGNPNFIVGDLAFGEEQGYFYSKFTEGLVSLTDNSIDRTLNSPYAEGDYSLGRRMKDYQHALFELGRGRKISEEDLDFICEVLGTEVIKRKHEGSSQCLLKPFEMKLNLKVINLKDSTINNIKNTYEARNVKSANWGFGGSFGIRYDLVLKEQN